MMFERYTDQARRVVFFARYEAGQTGAGEIGAEHLLLGLLREDAALAARFFNRPETNPDLVRKKIEANVGSKHNVQSRTDLTLASAAKRALAFAAEEAERLQDRHIGTEHLLLGLLRDESSPVAIVLDEIGLRLSDVRRELAIEPMSSQQVTQRISSNEVRPADPDERWVREVSEACLKLGVFTEEALVEECIRVTTMRTLPVEAEGLLGLLAAKGLADPRRLHSLASDLRDEKRLAEFLEGLQ